VRALDEAGGPSSIGAVGDRNARTEHDLRDPHRLRVRRH
jgi:hypothetical protein